MGETLKPGDPSPTTGRAIVGWAVRDGRHYASWPKYVPSHQPWTVDKAAARVWLDRRGAVAWSAARDKVRGSSPPASIVRIVRRESPAEALAMAFYGKSAFTADAIRRDWRGYDQDAKVARVTVMAGTIARLHALGFDVVPRRTT